MKKILFAFMAVALFVACNNSTKTTNNTDAVKEECSPVSVDSFLVIAPDFVGKEITVTGTVDHVCKHGGKRIKMFSSCPSKSVHAEAGETMGNFKAEIEGSSVCVVGVVAESKMDMAYVEEYEAKIKKAIEESKDEADMEHKKGVDHHAQLKQIEEWKAEIAASEKGYLSTYYLEAVKYHECKGDCKDHEAKSACCSKEVAKKTPCGSHAKDSSCGGCADKEAKPCD